MNRPQSAEARLFKYHPVRFLRCSRNGRGIRTVTAGCATVATTARHKRGARCMSVGLRVDLDANQLAAVQPYDGATTTVLNKGRSADQLLGRPTGRWQRPG